MRVVRSIVLCSTVLCSPAFGADLSDMFLRGSQPGPAPSFVPGSPVYPRWSGFYVGGDIGTSSGAVNFGTSTRSLVSYILRNTAVLDLLQPDQWTTLPKGHASGDGWGAFAGYNSQWDEVILGLELNYYNNGSQFKSAASDSVSRFQVSGTTRYDVTVAANSSLLIHDYATLRGRAGWILGSFLPYATLGLAVGRADVSRSATVTELERDVTDPNPANWFRIGGIGPTTQDKTKLNDYIYGVAAGLGLDYMLTQNVFLRAEWEWVNFSNIEGVKAYMNTGRVGAAFKF